MKCEHILREARAGSQKTFRQLVAIGVLRTNPDQIPPQKGTITPPAMGSSTQSRTAVVTVPVSTFGSFLRHAAYKFAPMSSPESYALARQRIDAAHAADPNRTVDGQPAELVYADNMEKWITRLVPDASPLLRLAARCQHLERWVIPRASYPEGKVGYLQWRRSLYQKQAERARQILLEAGVSESEAGDVATWVSKSGLKTNPGTQALEDAAVLVFLESEIGAFAAQHADYPREKFVDILRKTWRKLSPAGQAAASALELPPEIGDLVREATAAAGS